MITLAFILLALTPAFTTLLALIGVMLALPALTARLEAPTEVVHPEPWMAALEAELAPSVEHRLVDMGIMPSPWAMPAKLALLLTAPTTVVYMLPQASSCDDDMVPPTVRCAA